MNKNKKMFKEIVDKYRTKIQAKIKERKKEMLQDENTHFLLYQALGITPDESLKIDVYQNIGRFVYKYAGAMLEDLASTAIANFVGGKKIKIKNNISTDPKTFEIDCYVMKDNKAHEIKWRDATTDGDHIKKEHNKIMAIIKSGMTPVRIMFYMPQRTQAIRIQKKVIALYKEHGEAYVGQDAWNYIKTYAKVDLLKILQDLAKS